MTGWIKVYRQIRNHWIFDNPEYFRAWVIILMEVNHEKSKVLVKNHLIECGRGESLKSLETWASVFGPGWTKKKVLTFFNLLKKDTMIVTESVTVTTRLTVCNYESYQNRGNATEPQEDTAEGTQRERRGYTNKNNKE